MKAVVQRVHSASVAVGPRTMGRIGRGICVFVAVEAGDGERELAWVARKLGTLRLFPNDAGRLDRSVVDVDGSVLLVSNFTVAGRVRKGTRPDFGGAADPDRAFELFHRLAEQLGELGVAVQTGEFAADMTVDVANDGPVTLVVERSPKLEEQA